KATLVFLCAAFGAGCTIETDGLKKDEVEEEREDRDRERVDDEEDTEGDGTGTATAGSSGETGRQPDDGGEDGAAALTLVNGMELTEEGHAALTEIYGMSLAPGSYWYDAKSGLIGVEGYGAAGFIYPGHPLGDVARNASRGDSGVLLN